jgi:hypothetical protein
MEFERVFYKNDFAAGAALLSIYMIFGGTNWGNLGHPGGYTSYDYGSSITENRELFREKYSELKLEANFLKVSPAYLTASVGTPSTGAYTNNTSIYTTPLFGNGSATNFYVVRHSDYQTEVPASYSFKVFTSKGDVSIPQLGGSLTLSGRDSKCKPPVSSNTPETENARACNRLRPWRNSSSLLLCRDIHMEEV